jgi:DNA-binding NarL/FixJ family response regulator
VASVLRVMVVEDHPVVARGVADILGSRPDMRFVGLAGSVDEAVNRVAVTRPDVVVCDVIFGGVPTGFELPEALRRSGSRDVPVLFYSAFDLPWFYARALQVGGAGYVLKTASPAALMKAIEQVAAGDRVFAAEVLEAAAAVAGPSVREVEVLALVAGGRGNIEIAARLRVSPRTVESHLKRLSARYQVRSRTELVTFAIGQGWLAVGPEGIRRRSR